MYINEKLVYLALQKTGCTHVLKLLSSLPQTKGEIVGKHNTIYQISKEKLGDLTNKVKAGNIRNPWDWYVSLWAYGSMDKGALYTRLASGSILKKITQPRTLFGSSKEWRKVYSDNTNPELFRQWLTMILSTHIPDVGEGYGSAALSKDAGLMTYRYLKLYTYDFNQTIKKIKSLDDARKFDADKNFIDHFLFSENLENDFKSLMIKTGISENEIKHVLNSPKTNSSIRNTGFYHQ